MKSFSQFTEEKKKTLVTAFGRFNPPTIGHQKLIDKVAKVAGKTINIEHIDGPLGVRGRNSNNDLIREKLDWDFSMSLEEGIAQTYEWIQGQIVKKTPIHVPV